MPRSRFLAAALLTALALPACTDDVSDPFAPQTDAVPEAFSNGIKVMSQNMYLGANIDLLLTAQTPAEVGMVFQQLGTSTLAGNFGRAQRLAYQIAMQAPHVVGLQEVTTYDMTTGAGTQTLDFLDVLQLYLNYFHAQYGTPAYAAYRAVWTDVTFPASMFNPSFPDVRYRDGDAVLVRADVPLLEVPTLKAYDTFEVFQVAGTSFDNRRGYIALKVQVGDQAIRFINTHLEVQMFEPTQLAQTQELIETFADETIPVIMVGDFNSAANHDAPQTQKTGSYRAFRNAGFADIWLRQAGSVGGVTCCQAADLTNSVSELGQRLDLVLVRWGSAGFGGKSFMEVIGEEQADRIEVQAGLTLWPSDHAGVVATLWPAPGRLGN